MSSNIICDGASEAARLMRRAIVNELPYPAGPNDAPPVDMMQQRARYAPSPHHQRVYARLRRAMGRGLG
jgi:hypothetical protein